MTLADDIQRVKIDEWRVCSGIPSFYIHQTQTQIRYKEHASIERTDSVRSHRVTHELNNNG
jgi:hypothetical protein